MTFFLQTRRAEVKMAATLGQHNVPLAGASFEGVFQRLKNSSGIQVCQNQNAMHCKCGAFTSTITWQDLVIKHVCKKMGCVAILSLQE